MEDRCEELAHPDSFLVSVSIFLVVGILISYVPQHWKILERKTSEGLSPLFVLLGYVSATASFTNILTLPETIKDIPCCQEINGTACMAALLGVTQIFVQWGCFSFILYLFLLFFPRSDKHGDSPRSTPSVREHPKDSNALPTWKEALIVLYISLAFLIFCFTGSLMMFFGYRSHMRAWANSLGIFGAILAGIQYLPQIYTTWKRQAVGSLSVPMMCMQTPGSFVFAASLYARVGKKGWSVWALFILTGCLQGCLLVMSLWFLWREHKAGLNAQDNDLPAPDSDSGAAADIGIQPPSETTPLLAGQGGSVGR